VKNILIALMITTSLLVAQESEKRAKELLMKQMSTMESGMAQIQKGFLYNNLTLVEDGVLKVRETIRSIVPTDTRDLLAMRENAVNKFSRKQINKIDSKVFKLLERFREDDKGMALHHYTKVLKECMKCHVQVRKW
jgi:cytochrome c556